MIKQFEEIADEDKHQQRQKSFFLNLASPLFKAVFKQQRKRVPCSNGSTPRVTQDGVNSDDCANAFAFAALSINQ